MSLRDVVVAVVVLSTSGIQSETERQKQTLVNAREAHTAAIEGCGARM